MDTIEAKKLVIKAGVELVHSGLIARTWGNVSCRVDESTFAITPSGKDYLTLTVDDIVEVNIKDLSYSGPMKPSSEKGLHAAVYRLRPNINFVIHTHQENASAISAMELDYIILPENLTGLKGKIVLAKYALPGTKALCKNVIAALKDSKENAIILKHHGALCFGVDNKETFETANQLEISCGTYINMKDDRIQTARNREDQYKTKGLNQYEEVYINVQKKGYLLLNDDPDVLGFSSLGIDLKPFLDDFAQIVGIKAKTVENRQDLILKAFKKSTVVLIKDIGALCWGKNQSEASAISMITRKNCKAYFGSALFGKPKPINPVECALMRFVYLKKYSTLVDESVTSFNKEERT